MTASAAVRSRDMRHPFRNIGIPVLLLLYFLYYGLPSLVPGLRIPAEVAAILGFGLNYAAYEAEIYRTGIGSIAKGQWEAAASLGAGTRLAQLTVTSAGMRAITGALLSLTVIVCVALLWLPHTSVARYTRAIV